jgi:initiation factor 1A
MVKNTTGGSGAKSLARKNEKSSSSRIRLAEDELERYGCVTKLFGNGMCEIHTNDNIRLMGHIRNKFRGKQKRHNLITMFSVVLIGLREWENPFKNCDILTIYDDMQIEQLKNIPSIKINHILLLRTTGAFSGAPVETNIEFSLEEEDEPIKKIGGDVTDVFVLEQKEEIDIDDI